MNKLNIDMPSDFEIDNQINNIVEQVIKEKESFYSYIKNMYKTIGFKNLFHDISELTFVVILSLSIIILAMKNITRDSFTSSDSIYAFIFIMSPLLYFATNLFSYINMKENNTYQVEMVCKYNIFQISSLRMLAFSTICILVNTILIIVMYNKIIFMKGIMISITSLFLFSTINLYTLINIKNNIMKYVIVIGWVALNCTLYIRDISMYSDIISGIPNYVYLMVSIGSMYIYIKNIKKLSGYEKLSLEV